MIDCVLHFYNLCRLRNVDIPIISCVVSNVNRGTWEWEKKSMRLDYIWAFHSKPLENRLDIREGISADLRKENIGDKWFWFCDM